MSRFDLVQVHNRLNWQEHLPTLFALKAAGQVRYVGITTSEGRHLRDSGDDQRRPRAREHECGFRPHAGRGDASAHRRGGGAGLMSEWWTYTLSDFLMSSPQTYWRLVERYNLAIWPAQMAGAASGLAIVMLVVRDRRRDVVDDGGARGGGHDRGHAAGVAAVGMGEAPLAALLRAASPRLPPVRAARTRPSRHRMR